MIYAAVTLGYTVQQSRQVKSNCVLAIVTMLEQATAKAACFVINGIDVIRQANDLSRLRRQL